MTMTKVVDSPISVRAKREQAKKDKKDKPVKDFLEGSYLEKAESIALSNLKEGESKEIATMDIVNKLRCNQDTASSVVDSVYAEMATFMNFNVKPEPEMFSAYMKHFWPNTRKSELSGRIENDGFELGEYELNNLFIDLRLFGMKKLSMATFYLLLNSRYVPVFNPIKEFFSKNKDTATSGNNIKLLAESIKSNAGMEVGEFYPQFVETMLKRWMVGAIASLYGEKKNNLYIILVGPQNSGKTNFCRELLPKDISRFMNDGKLEPKMNEADLATLVAESFIVLDNEFGAKEDFRFIKATLDRPHFYLRKPYGKGNEKITRLASFIATTNEYELLGDNTGNRRLIPIATANKLDFEKYNSIDKTALWIEAYKLFKAGERWELSNEEIKMLNDCTKQFEKTDEVIEKIQKYFDVPKENETRYIDKLTASDIVSELRVHGVKCYPQNLGVKMKKIGFEQEKDYVENVQRRFYAVCRKV